MNARTDTVIRITPIEYREFAEIAKASGMVLRSVSYTHLTLPTKA